MSVLLVVKVLLVAVLAFIAGAISLGPKYVVWKRRRNFAWLAEHTHSFESGRELLENMRDPNYNGHTREILSEFDDAMFRRMAELAEYEEDVAWFYRYFRNYPYFDRAIDESRLKQGGRPPRSLATRVATPLNT